MEEANRWLGLYEEGWEDGSRAGFAIVDSETEAFLGMIAFVVLRPESLEGEVGYIVAPAPVRPARRAAFRFRTALPVSTAERLVPSGRTTRLPYGILFGSTAQCPTCNRVPVADLFPA